MANIPFSAQTRDFFYPLDNSAVFIAATTGKASPFVYRMSCELDRPIHLPDLESALDRVAERFPFFKTELRPGMFWYYLDPLKKPFTLSADTRFPVVYHRLGQWNRYLFRVRVFGSRIACEFHHVLTDGTGAIEFLKCLVATYLSLRGVECADWQGIKQPGLAVDPAEMEDAYANNSRKNIQPPDSLQPAFKLPGNRYRGPEYRVTTGSMSVAQTLKIAREKGVTLTELLAAFHLAALQSVCESRSGTNYSPVCIQVPVNVRRFYPSPTMRNFFLFVPVSIDRRLGHYELPEILDRVHYSFRLNLTRKELDRQIRRNVRGEEYIFSRLVPLVLKNGVLRLIGRLSADKPYSGSISNLQGVSMPEPFAEHIRRFDFIPARNAVVGANIAVISWKDTLSVSVGSLAQDRSFERFFFSALVDSGIPVTVESNI
jgi:hypothetical protein